MNYFFIGIKGSGMSALALILKNYGHNVSGSDVDTHYFTMDKLIANDIEILPFGSKNNFDDIDIVILGNAFNEEHIDYVNAKNQNVKIVKYFDELNKIVLGKKSIAISGTNGKTTTTGLAVEGLKHLTPSYLIGDGTGVGNANSDFFLFEACEYKKTFLNYTPEVIVINNIEFDHPDFFKDVEHVINTFEEFSHNAKAIVLNGDDENCKKITHDKIISFGKNDRNDIKVENVKYVEEGIIFDLYEFGKFIGNFTLPFYGEHMLYNSLSVIAIASYYREDLTKVIENLKGFKGVNRRFNEEIISSENNIYLIDDYAHHGTAIDLTLSAIKQKYPSNKTITIFQPHTFSRVESFKKEFAKSLINSDEIILVDIFGSAREKDSNITVEVIKDEITALGCSNKLKTFDDLDNTLKDTTICLLGAGDIDLLYKDKIKKIFR